MSFTTWVKANTGREWDIFKIGMSDMEFDYLITTYNQYCDYVEKSPSFFNE